MIRVPESIPEVSMSSHVSMLHVSTGDGTIPEVSVEPNGFPRVHDEIKRKDRKSKYFIILKLNMDLLINTIVFLSFFNILYL